MEAASCEEECAGRVLGYGIVVIDVKRVSGIVRRSAEATCGTRAGRRESFGLCVPCRADGLATVLREVQTAASLLLPQPKLSTQPTNKLRS